MLCWWRYDLRTSIILDDELVERANLLTGIKTKRELIDQALRALIQVHEQSELISLRGQLHWEGDLDALRRHRIH